jgi:NitT/TauT family transport system permease protein
MERIDRRGGGHLGGTHLSASGLGSYIATAAEDGDFHRVLTGVGVMAAFVVGLNRLFWRRLYRLSERRYSSV